MERSETSTEKKQGRQEDLEDPGTQNPGAHGPESIDGKFQADGKEHQVNAEFSDVGHGVLV